MPASSIISIVVGLLLAAVVYVVGTAITNFRNEDLLWGLVAIVIFLVVAFREHRGRL